MPLLEGESGEIAELRQKIFEVGERASMRHTDHENRLQNLEGMRVNLLVINLGFLFVITVLQIIQLSK